MCVRNEMLALSFLFFLGGCSRQAAIVNNVEMSVRGEVVASKNYTITIEEEVSRNKDYNVMYFNIAARRLSIRVIETKYTSTDTRVKVISEVYDDMPSEADLLHETRNGFDYFGYYLPVEVKDWSGHGFDGYVFGKTSWLFMGFAFVNLEDLSIAKNIWLSAKAR
jgi:hypothetical protein